ncbi:MAG TPA: vitamin K epoxide reductase family protein [Thermoleophilaceae bacterium]
MKRLDIAIGVIALIGLGIAGYLTYVHYAGLHPLCLASGGCEKVQSSHWSKLGGIPVATLGLVGYAAILVLLFVPGEIGLAGSALVALVGFGFSIYLTYAELFKIHAVCQWCVASAVLMTLLAVLTVIRLMTYEERRAYA